MKDTMKAARAKYLSGVSGLSVSVSKDNGEPGIKYEFWSGFLAVYTTFSYVRAKAFAKGVSVGRTC